MKKIQSIPLLIMVFTWFNGFSQVQKKFFVDDVLTVDYVTVNFCVGDDARINKVTIIEDKTTYLNKENIQNLKDYLLAIEYYPDSKLRGNCYDSTFEFINSSYQKLKLSEEDCQRCLKFSKGEYLYENVLYTKTKIKRRKRIQREITTNNGRQIYRIKWNSNCNYILTYLRMSEDRYKHLIGKEILVEIIGILSNDRYVYKSTAEFDGNIVIGVMKRIN